MTEPDFVSTDRDELVSWLLASQGVPSMGDLETAMARAGRVHGPYIVSKLHDFGRLSADTAAVLVPTAWGDSEYPMDSLPETRWRELFGVAGYTENGKAADRPAEPLILYRGAPYEYRRRWAWTDELRQADRFARHQIRGRLPGEIWTATVEPWRLFAFIDDGESEYVIDTRGLTVTRYLSPYVAE